MAGAAAIDGNSQWNVGDIIIFDGAAWEKIDGVSNEVVSVAGLYGVISASGLKTALSLSSGDVAGLGSLATQSTVNLASQAVSGSYSVALNAAADTSLSLPASGTLATTAQLNAGSISGLAASATTDTTNASNIASGTLPAARLPNPSTSALGGVQSATASANQFMTGINTSGAPLFAQPSASNISGLGALASQSAVNLSSQVTGALPYSSLSGAPVLGSLASLSSVNNSNWSGTPLSTANGGTGQTTAATAFNALSPMTAAGDMICGGASGAGTRLPAGNTSEVLIGGTVPSWGAVNLGSMVTGSLPAASVSGLAASATTDTTNASNITSGTLPAARLPLFSNSANGAVAASGGGTSNFLRADGTWAAPPAGALTSPVAVGSNTLLATPLTGDLEYDGEALYFSPVAGVRGVVPVYQCSRVTASGGVSLANSASAQSFLPSGAQNFPVQAGAIYRFRAKVLLNTGNSNSRTVSSLFATGGGAAFSWISYSTKAYGSASMGNMNFDWVAVMNSSSARTMTSFNSYVWYELQMEGEFVMSSAGTIQPQIQFSAAPGGTNVNMQGSYFGSTPMDTTRRPWGCHDKAGSHRSILS